MRVAQLVARLQSQHIEVSRSDAAFKLAEGTSRPAPMWCASTNPIATTRSIC
jgi:hypothetical protein